MMTKGNLIRGYIHDLIDDVSDDSRKAAGSYMLKRVDEIVDKFLANDIKDDITSRLDALAQLICNDSTTEFSELLDDVTKDKNWL